MFRLAQYSLAIVMAFAQPSISATLIHSYDFNQGAVIDTVGGLNGTLVGNATIEDGALVLDGDGDSAEISGGYAIPTIGNDFSVALRAQQTSSSFIYELISQGRSNTGALGFGFYIGSLMGQIRLGDRFPATEVRVAFPTDKLWHSYVLTSGAGVGTEFFIDGNSVFRGPPMNVISGGDITRFGRQFSPPGGEYFPGKLDDIKIWSGVISNAEVAAYSNPEIVPLPASAPLLLAGVLAIGALRKKRAVQRISARLMVFSLIWRRFLCVSKKISAPQLQFRMARG